MKGSAIPTFDVARAIDILRELSIKTHTMVTAAEHHLERFAWGGEEDDADADDEEDEDLKLEHMAHLLSAAKEAARAAVSANSQIAAELAKHRSNA